MLLWVTIVAKLPAGTMKNEELRADNEFKASPWRLRLGSRCLAGTTNNGECLCSAGTTSALFPDSCWDTTREPMLMFATPEATGAQADGIVLLLRSAQEHCLGFEGSPPLCWWTLVKSTLTEVWRSLSLHEFCCPCVPLHVLTPLAFTVENPWPACSWVKPLQS